MRQLAIIVALPWAVWWTVFVFALGLSKELPLISILVQTGVCALLLLGSVLLSWKKVTVGANALLILGVLTGIWCLSRGYEIFPPKTAGLITLGLACPPILAGFLFIAPALKRGKL